MNEVRMGQIALLLIKYKLSKDGLGLLTQNFPRELGNIAKHIGISLEELMEFAEKLTREKVDEIFPPK